MEITFQIKENYGKGCGGWSYFDAQKGTPISELTKMAIQKVKEENEKQAKMSFFGNYKPASPTIIVSEYDGKTKRKLKGGIEFKTKWR